MRGSELAASAGIGGQGPGDHLCSLKAASEARKKVFSPGGAGHILLQKLI